MRNHILNYSKTRDTYVAYRKSGYSKKFYEQHREEITIHKAAKLVFSELEGAKIPKIKELNEEFQSVLGKKKEAYKEYHNMKSEMQNLLVAKQNIDIILNADLEEMKKQKNQNKDQESRKI